MTDELDRLFHEVVRALAARGPGRLAQPVQIAELYQDLVPYRQFRDVLRFDTYQDYETALLRLLAGERGYATVEPPEARQAMVVESQAAYPDPAVIREYAAARAYLDPAAAQTVLAGASAYAPAALQPPAPPAGGAEAAGAAAGAAAAAEPQHQSRPAHVSPGEPCPYCGAELPAGREAFYCPFCGGNVRGVTCPECRTELEVGWAYCITCGRKMTRA